jgi:hypothetical protein
MTLNFRHVLAIAALVIFIIAAILGFTWFGTTTDLRNVIGFVSLGLACLAGALVVP